MVNSTKRTLGMRWGWTVAVAAGLGLLVVASGAWSKRFPTGGAGSAPRAEVGSPRQALPDDSDLLLPGGEARLEEQARTVRLGPRIPVEAITQPPPANPPAEPAALSAGGESFARRDLLGWVLGSLACVAFGGLLWIRRRRGAPLRVAANGSEAAMITRTSHVADDASLARVGKRPALPEILSPARTSSQRSGSPRPATGWATASPSSSAPEAPPLRPLEARAASAAGPTAVAPAQRAAGTAPAPAAGATAAAPAHRAARTAPAPAMASASGAEPPSSLRPHPVDPGRVARLENSVLTLAETVRELSERIPQFGGSLSDDDPADWESAMIELLDLEPEPSPPASEVREEPEGLSPWEHFLAEQEPARPESARLEPVRLELVPTTVAPTTNPTADRGDDGTIGAAALPDDVTDARGAGPGTGAVRSWVRSRAERNRSRPAPQITDLEVMRDQVIDMAARGVSVPEICTEVGLGRHEVQLILRTLFGERHPRIPAAESGTNGR